MSKIAALLALALAAALAGCGDSGRDYMKVAGGGVVFNYRVAEATYGVTLTPQREIPKGARLLASFDDPAGGPRLETAQTIVPGRPRYSVTSPPVKGIRKGDTYRIAIRLQDAAGRQLGEWSAEVHADLDQSVLPDKALTVGPGYTPNPQAQ
ncbi:MAG: hypothetical protein AB7L41_04310 [Flavobacteriaceae bacterium]